MTAVMLRPADEDDARFVWEVNNEPSVRAQSISTDPIPWDAHQEWFADALQRDDRQILIVGEAGRDRGVVRFDRDGGDATISIAIAADARGRGLGTRSIASGCRLACADEDVERVLAYVRPDNPASIKAFERADFEFRETTRQDGVELNLYVRECG